MSWLCTGLKQLAGATSQILRSKNGCVALLGQNSVQSQITSAFHTSHVSQKKSMAGPPSEPKRWLKYNDIVYPPQQPGEPMRPAEICHQRANIKYSQKKMWYIASMIRGMSIDEALKQLSFYNRKGAAIVKEVLEEAQELAVTEHNVEYKSNLWIADSFINKARTIKGVRKMARRRTPGIILYRYTHYMVRLREGRPPKHYFAPPMTGNQKMEDYLSNYRKRTVIKSL